MLNFFKASGFGEIVANAFEMVFEALACYTNNKTIAFDQFRAFQSCIEVDLDTTRAAYVMVDTDKDGKISKDEYCGAVADYVSCTGETGPGAKFLGVVN